MSAIQVSAVAVAPSARSEVRTFLWRAGWFVAIALLIHGVLYAASEEIARRYAVRNRFFAVRYAAHTHYDHVILGASHAAVFDYRDMNARLEQMTGTRILNLAVQGGGVTVNHLLLDYFLARRQTSAVVYVVDSFVFYSREWNENRLADVRLYARAPFDSALARLLMARSPAVALDYITGFSKINNPNRFAADVFAEEGNRFDRTYRRVPQIDQQRFDYLYPGVTDPGLFARYLREFETLVQTARAGGLRFTAVKPPLPNRVLETIPREAQFDAALREVLGRHGAIFVDLSRAGNDDRFFYDTDHLNRDGVLNFFEHHFRKVLDTR